LALSRLIDEYNPPFVPLAVRMLDPAFDGCAEKLQNLTDFDENS
jgi:hypothetical protein